jgi:hypothetical protein
MPRFELIGDGDVNAVASKLAEDKNAYGIVDILIGGEVISVLPELGLLNKHLAVCRSSLRTVQR